MYVRSEREEVLVFDGGPSRYSLPGLEQKEGAEERHAVRIQPGGVGYQGLGGVGRELVAGQLIRLGDTGPRLLSWRT